MPEYFPQNGIAKRVAKKQAQNLVFANYADSVTPDADGVATYESKEAALEAD